LSSATAEVEHPALVAAARHGLAVEQPPVRIAAADTDVVLHRARFDHLTGLLARAVIDGVVLIDDEDAAPRLRRQWHEELVVCVALEALAVRTAGVFDHAEVTWRLTKGAAVAHLDYPEDPAVRTFGDVDLVVHPDHWARAVAALTDAAYERVVPPLPGGYDARWGKGATMLAPDGSELDLHRRFAIGRFGVTTNMADVFDPHDTITLAGRPIPVLDPVGRLLHACYHASLGGFRRLRAFRDVAQLVLVTGADWEAAFGVARSWRGEPVVASAIAETWRRMGLDPGHPAVARAATVPVGAADRRALALFGRGAPFRRQALTALPRLRPAEIPAYLWNLSGSRRRRRG
jgi:hypothetical protein